MSGEFDVVVLGGGIVGVCAALQLQLRGRGVVLIDRAAPGMETSFGNAGVIQVEAVYPYMFPRSWGTLMRYASNRSGQARYHRSALLKLARPFSRYWRNSSADRSHQIAQWRAPLVLRSAEDHAELARLAGVSHLLQETGWTHVFSNQRDLDNAGVEVEQLAEFGVPALFLDAADLGVHEPALRRGLCGALHFPTPISVRDPLDLTNAYTKLFTSLGGSVQMGDARTLSRESSSWRVCTEQGVASARDVVVALGPWSTDITKKFGYEPPMFVKRGYHTHFSFAPNGGLNRPVLDVTNGYVLAPMRNGVRLATGAEFADRDAAPTPVQVDYAEPHARKFMPSLGTRIGEKAWMGSRPCLPDMLPIVGPTSGEKGLWCLFGHAHQGLTLAATTGRLLAEMMIGDPFTDPTPYRADRF